MTTDYEIWRDSLTLAVKMGVTDAEALTNWAEWFERTLKTRIVVPFVPEQSRNLEVEPGDKNPYSGHLLAGPYTDPYDPYGCRASKPCPSCVARLQLSKHSPGRCPTCESPDPDLHPAPAGAHEALMNGNAEFCTDTFHQQ